MATKGKKFESEISKSLSALRKMRQIEYWSSNATSPICDHIIILPSGEGGPGTSILVEEKETHSDRFNFRAVSDNERKNLAAFRSVGCGAWVLIKRILGWEATVYACPWGDWLALERETGYRHGERQTRGCASFKISEQAEAGRLLSVPRRNREDAQGYSLGYYWDLSVIMEDAQ